MNQIGADMSQIQKLAEVIHLSLVLRMEYTSYQTFLPLLYTLCQRTVRASLELSIALQSMQGGGKLKDQEEEDDDGEL